MKGLRGSQETSDKPAWWSVFLPKTSKMEIRNVSTKLICSLLIILTLFFHERSIQLCTRLVSDLRADGTD
jgi:hypothetical protein